MKKFHIPTDWQNHYNMVIFEEIDSTNEEAKRIAGKFEEGEFVVWSKSQTAGKGRNGKKWSSPKGNIYLSVLMRSVADIALASYLPFIVALAVGKFICEHATNKELVNYKWPNDILYDQKKISGILIETKIKPKSNNLEWLIVGAGINLSAFPKNLPYAATSLKENCEDNVDAEKAIDEFMRNFLYYMDVYNKKGFEKIRSLWLKNAFGVGSTITVSTSNNRISGIFKDLNQDGAIELELSSGEIKVISSGEVFFDKQKNPFNNY